MRDKKAPARENNKEIGLNPILDIFLRDKKAPARDDNKEIGLNPILRAFLRGITRPLPGMPTRK